LKLETLTIAAPFRNMGGTGEGWYFKNEMTISLHFFSLSLIFCWVAYLLIPLAMRGR